MNKKAIITIVVLLIIIIGVFVTINVINKKENVKIIINNDEESESMNDIKEDLNVDNVVTINGKEYSFNVIDNNTSKDILNMLPVEQEFIYYANHEYYTELPSKPNFDSEKTFFVEEGGIYYWDGWNALVFNVEDTDITPYKVVKVGSFDGELLNILKDEKTNITMKVGK